MTRPICVSLALMLLAGSAAAEDVAGPTLKKVDADAPARAEKPDLKVNVPPYSLNTLDFNFPTGLRVLMQPDHSQPMVAITAIYDRGSTSDPVGKEGIAHFVEHLWFRSEHGELPKTWDVLAELGCNLNASTSDDWTNYMSNCPKSALPALLKLESLRITEPVIGVTQEMVDPEREVIRNELRMRMENGGGELLRYVNAKLYPEGHPYHRMTIGTHESLSNIQLADIVAFTDKNYRPENTTIVVVGDFDPEEASSLIFQNFDLKLLHPRLTENDLFRTLKPGAKEGSTDPADYLWGARDPDHPDQALGTIKPPQRITDQIVEPPAPNDTKPETFVAPVEHAEVVVAWTLPGAYRKDDLLMNYTAGIAGYFVNDVLKDDYRTHAYEEGQVAACFLMPSKLSSAILCFAEIDDKKDGYAIGERIIDQMATLWNPDLTEALNTNLSRQRMAQLTNVLQSLDLFATIGGGKATDIAHHAHFTGSARYHSDLMNQVMGIEATAIAQFAQKYLKRDRAVVAVFDPLPDEDILKDSSESDYHGAQSTDDEIKSALPADQITAAVIMGETNIPDMSKLRDLELPNGLHVTIMPHGEAPMVGIRMLARGGWASDPRGLDIVAQEFRDEEASDELQIAGTWGGASGPNWTAIDLTASGGNLDGALWMMRDRVESINVNLGGRPEWTKDIRKAVQADWLDEDYWTSHVIAEHLSPGHNIWLSNPISGESDYSWEDQARMSAFSSAELTAYLQSQWQPKGSQLLIVGNVDADEAEKLAIRYFGGWKAGPQASADYIKPIPPPTATKGRKIFVFDDQRVTQTQVDLYCPLALATPENAAERSVIGAVLRDRLFSLLRAESGVSYSPSGGAIGQPGGLDAMYLTTLTQNNGVSITVSTFDKVLAEAESTGFNSDHVAVVKLHNARTYVLGQQSIDQMTSRLSGPFLWGAGWDYITKYPERLAAVNSDQIKALTAGCKDNAVLTIVGPKDVITPQLDAIGYSYEVLDVEKRGEELLGKYDPKALKKHLKDKAKKDAKKAKEDAKKGTTTPAPAPTPTPEPAPAPAPAPAPTPTEPPPPSGP